MNPMTAASPARDLDRLAPAAIVLASVGAIAIAYVAELGFGIEPCRLCLYQRAVYAVAGVGGLATLLVAPGPRRAIGIALCGGVFAVGAGIAFYHVGVEQHWWASAVCEGGKSKVPETVDQLRAMLTEKPPKPCDERDWTLFGVSVATYNVGASVALAFGCFWAAERMRKQP
jgi:disulfide bond formation protein DsbB